MRDSPAQLQSAQAVAWSQFLQPDLRHDRRELTITPRYVCNDQDVDLDVPMNEVVTHIRYIHDICLAANQGDGEAKGSGRVVTTDRNGYNGMFPDARGRASRRVFFGAFYTSSSLDTTCTNFVVYLFSQRRLL